MAASAPIANNQNLAFAGVQTIVTTLQNLVLAVNALTVQVKTQSVVNALTTPYAFNNISTIPQLIVAANADRTSITFYNPGTVDIYVAPTIVNNVPLVPNLTSLGGCITVYANGGNISSTCQQPWQAFAASGTTNPLTVMDR